jgi:hypothetical protein
MHFVKLGFAFLVFSVFAMADHVVINGKTFTYPTGSRFEAIAPQLLEFKSPYWPSSHIRTKNSQQEALALKSRIMKDLKQYGGVNKDFNKLYWDVNYFNPFGRLAINLDPDWFRLRVNDNPRLIGDYEVSINSRPKYILILGMTNQAKKGLISNKPVSTAVIDRSLYRAAADLDFIYIVSPDGQLNRFGHAYWNRLERDLMPGSIVYVPIKEKELPENLKNINADVLKFLASAEERSE